MIRQSEVLAFTFGISLIGWATALYALSLTKPAPCTGPAAYQAQPIPPAVDCRDAPKAMNCT